MSTFGGVIEEFPDIRVDYFRQIRPKSGQKPVPPALACFLSHVHSDHVEGLEAPSFRGPFIYCSAATKELLLRLEKYPHRLNFALGILEAQKVHFKHLKSILKPIPLETPTRIELSPGNEIQVTLFDANHCTGAVMFLFEGNGKAVLYTGDIRSEPWFVSNISRNPFLIEYTSGLKTLDCIYLDTSNIVDIPFPTKAAGLKELLKKVSDYPPDTVFHFEAWTFGYEEVWMALSKFLKTPIHVDRYKYKLYQSLRGDSAGPEKLSGPFLAHEGPVLTGYTCGNTPQEGYLTNDTNVRLHSCERGLHCSAINEKAVWIRPIITRTNGEDMPEIGVGGGGGDLNQHPALVLNDHTAIEEVMGLFTNVEYGVQMDIKKMLSAGLGAAGRAISLDGMNFDRDENELSLTQMAKIVAQSVAKKRRNSQPIDTFHHNGQDLPKVISFPYSRHSSYQELVDLVGAFQPRDVYPCTVDDDYWNQEGVTISDLFGHVCSSEVFRHDHEMEELFPGRLQIASQHTQETSPRSSQLYTNSPEISRLCKPGTGNQRMRTLATSLEDSEQRLPAARQPSDPTVHFRKNTEGRIRTFDTDGNELAIKSETLGMTTPHQHITAATPGPESQNLRRKAIFDEIRGNPKRARLQDDRAVSSPPLSPILGTNGSVENDEDILVLGSSQNSGGVNTPGSEIDSDFHSGVDDLKMVFDLDDQIYRCKLCLSEIWGGHDGFCTGCEEGPHSIPYYEDLVGNPFGHGRPGIVGNEYTDQELEGEERKAIVGETLDDDSSAYDSQDVEDGLSEEEYEKNSFIDDAQPNAEEETATDSASSSDGEEDYKAKYTELQTSYIALTSNYRDLEFDYREFRMEVTGEYSDEDDGHEPLDDDDEKALDEDDEERDEDDILIIDVPPPKVLTTDVILPSAEEQSDGSEISENRIRRRAEAFEAVDGVSGRSWHEISLVSTTNNHTHAEIEL